MLAMNASTGNVDDAVAMLRQAKREATDTLQPIATLALALALDRAGSRDEAKALLDDRAKAAARTIARDPSVATILGPLAFEGEAMSAVGLEASDAAAAQAAWQKYVEAAGQNQTWIEHARSHLTATKPATPPRGRR